MKNILFYEKPAKSWEEALPIGNGRLGAMIFSQPDLLRIQLNEISLWSGKSYDNADKKYAYTHLENLRELINSKQFSEAQKLLDKEFINNGGGFKGAYSGSYQTLGDMYIRFNKKCMSDFSRSLDIDNAVCQDSFVAGGVKISREYFSSAPDSVICIKIKADKEKALNLSVNFKRKYAKVRYTENGFVFEGYADNNKEKMAFAGALKVECNGTTLAKSRGFSISYADEVVMYFTAATDYCLDKSRNFKNGNNPLEVCLQTFKNLEGKTYCSIKENHIADYKELYDRCKLELGNKDNSDIDITQRLDDFSVGSDDIQLIALLFNFGRYLLISCSRENNVLPANLQGLWCKDYKAPWHCDYHANINVQMNYWPAGPTGLVECTRPFANLIEALTENGQKTAKAYYNAPGWTIYTITNPWLWTSPGWGGGWSQYPLGGAWLCKHLVEYYNYCADKSLLEEFYPVIKENCLFNMAVLCKNEAGKYITNPATSPENSFCDDEGNVGWVCKGTAMDIEMLYESFTDMINICDILQKDATFKQQAENVKNQLAELKIGKAGQLCEWEGDWDLNAPEPHHRHVSHLYGLHPGTMISVEKTPELADACRKTLDLRGDDGTGWSLAWKINFRARLYDGDRAYKLIKRLLRPVHSSSYNYSNGGGVYPNLFDAHPPFQIDGNFGAVSGICEMLLQSHVVDENGNFLIKLLPALPTEWKTGNINGIVARGNIRFDIEWENGSLKNCMMYCEKQVTAVLAGEYDVYTDGQKVNAKTEDSKTIFEMQKNVRYNLIEK